MTGGKHLDLPPRLHAGLANRGQRAQRRPLHAQEGVVDPVDCGLGAAGELGDRDHRVARPGGQRGGAGSLAGHVAHEGQPGVAELDRVVEVPAHLVGRAGGAEQDRGLPAGRRLERRRQQALLQRAGDPAAIGEQPRVLDRDHRAGRPAPRPAGCRPCENVRSPSTKRDRADHPVAEAQRRDHRRAQARPTAAARDAPRPGPPCTSSSSGISGKKTVSPVFSTVPRPVLSLQVGGIALAHPVGELHHLRVDVRHRHLLDVAVRRDELHAAPVGEAGDSQLGHILQGLLVVERGGRASGWRRPAAAGPSRPP